ncbi:hypothetical protein AOX56_21525 [Aeromonas sobria]|jgi:hypothetical protein|uniref:Lipoprotein n=1 Tax=Aeromonas sobria TaxID=646 RepID=A0A2N3IPQ3_AERSO|nr:hypothetical protein [Aeromonas sobria]PKQ73251.1 hypothetical protein AOX56_21525 [Aeromonas sobria]
MKKFAIVSFAVVMSGCSMKPPSQMTTDELCQELGRSQAAGDSGQIQVYEELKTRQADLGRCKMYYGLGVRQYHDGVRLMNQGLQMMANGG